MFLPANNRLVLLIRHFNVLKDINRESFERGRRERQRDRQTQRQRGASLYFISCYKIQTFIETHAILDLGVSPGIANHQNFELASTAFHCPKAIILKLF